MSKTEFDDDFKQKVLALSLRDDNFCQRVDGLIDTSFFDRETDCYIFSVAKNHYNKYESPPSPVALSHSFNADKASGVIRTEFVAPIASRIKTLYKTDVSDRDFIVESIATFARKQATELAVIEAATILDSGGDISTIMPIMQKALDVGATDLAQAYDYKETIAKRSEIRKARLKGEVAYNSVTTGFGAMDATLYRHGWGKGELSLYMAPSKGGKSAALIDHALRASEKGFNTLLVSLEVSTEIQVDRMDSNISNVPLSELDTMIDKVEERVTRWQATAGELKCHEYPSGTFKVSDLRRLIKKYQSIGVMFDLVVVDYADIMLSESKSDQGIDKSKQILIDLRALAQHENIAILSATQTNREGAKVETITSIHVADDYNKIRIADLVISINASTEEASAGEARLYYAASRNQKPVTIFVKRKLEVMRHIYEIIDVV